MKSGGTGFQPVKEFRIYRRKKVTLLIKSIKCIKGKYTIL